MTDLVSDLSIVINDLLYKNYDNIVNNNNDPIKKKRIEKIRIKKLLKFQSKSLKNIYNRVELFLNIIDYIQKSTVISIDFSLTLKFIEKYSFPDYVSTDKNLKIISFLDFFNNIYDNDKSKECITRALINNSYFFDVYENNLREINVILKYPEKFFITISEEHINYINNSLKVPKKIKNVSFIVHHAITLAFIYKLYNSKDLLNKLINISNNLLDLEKKNESNESDSIEESNNSELLEESNNSESLEVSYIEPVCKYNYNNIEYLEETFPYYYIKYSHY